MKNSSGPDMSKSAFTLIELLVVITILILLASLIQPAVSRSIERAHLAGCAAQLRQIGNAFTSFATENQGRMPGRNWWQRLGTQTQVDRFPGTFSANPQIPYFLGINPGPGEGDDIRGLACPAFPRELRRESAAPHWNVGYSYNDRWWGSEDSNIGRRIYTATDPARTFVVLDGVNRFYWGSVPAAIGDWSQRRHGRATPGGNFRAHTEGVTANVLMADGHVRSFTFGVPPLTNTADVAFYSRIQK